MGYLVQKTRAAQLLIGGQDYTSSLISFQVADSGAYNKGLMTTSGTLTLGQRPGGTDIEDYDRNLFRRGTLVTLDITEPGGAAYRHPRGYLYVISVAYSVEDEQLTVELGCRLSLAYLTDNPEAILPLIPIPLDPAQQTVQSCSASFASAGMILYQDNQGSLVSRKFFGTDSSAGIEPGEWVSVLGESALAVSPLVASGAIPDRIELAYQVPEGSLTGDQTGKVDTVTETSNYFLNYPATVWKRNPNPIPSGERQLPDTVTQNAGRAGTTNSCGQALSPPQPGGTTITPGGTENYFLCSDQWTTDRTNVYLPAVRVSTSTTTYGGPGGQTSYSEQATTGPEVEANPGYFADKYAYCVATYANACNPSGSCPYYGLSNRTLSKQTTTYFYGQANELVKTIQDNYQTVLSAYTPAEWRAGIQNGVPQGFNGDLTADSLYRQSQVINEYYKAGNSNIQVTTTYTSVTSRGVGPTAGAPIDALSGIKTVTRRESTSTTTLDIRPDVVNSVTTSTDEKTTRILLNTNSYSTPPTEAGAYVLEESIPVPLLSTDASQISAWVADYSNYLEKFVLGDTYGLQIAESMRAEIVANWYPGMPFSYADTANNRILEMRMDACTWGVTQDEAIVVTNGIWRAFNTGTLQLNNNLAGNSTPDMTPGGTNPTPPVGAGAPPSIVNGSIAQSFAFSVDVDLWIDASAFTYFPNGISTPNPTDLTGNVEQAIVPYCSGFIVAPGGLLATDGDGSIPLDYNGSIVTADATVINSDLFAAA